jgi:acetyl esterase/lipase
VPLDRLAGTVYQLGASRDGRVVACALHHRVPDVWAGPPEGKLLRVSDLAPELADVEWGSQERLAWRAPDRLELDGLLILPPGRTRDDGPFPLVLILHGGPYGRFGDDLQLGWALPAQWLATAGFAVFCPNPRGGLGHGAEFARTVRGAVGVADWRDVESGLERLVDEGVADPERLGLGGWSQGGYMTAWGVTQTARFRAAVVGAGPSDWGMMVAESDLPTFEASLGGSAGWEGPGPHRHDELSPISYAHRVTTPTLICTARKTSASLSARGGSSHGRCARTASSSSSCRTRASRTRSASATISSTSSAAGASGSRRGSNDRRAGVLAVCRCAQYLERWSVPGSNRRPPACKAETGRFSCFHIVPAGSRIPVFVGV